MLFDAWGDLVRLLVAGALTYLALVGTLRLSGKRTLAKLNAFDLVVTVALGSTLASVLLDRSVSLSEGVLGIVLLVALQYAVAAMAVRSARVRRVAKSEPTLLLHEGVLLTDRMTRQRVTAGEVRQAVRSQGIGALESVAAVVLETDGTLSVVPASASGTGSALADVAMPADSRAP
jgi:uncharacterized membrane protein YcaP (DUF421 family)